MYIFFPKAETIQTSTLSDLFFWIWLPCCFYQICFLKQIMTNTLEVLKHLKTWTRNQICKRIYLKLKRLKELLIESTKKGLIAIELIIFIYHFYTSDQMIRSLLSSSLYLHFWKSRINFWITNQKNTHGQVCKTDSGVCQCRNKALSVPLTGLTESNWLKMRNKDSNMKKKKV